jgi:hypothetical protein
MHGGLTTASMRSARYATLSECGNLPAGAQRHDRLTGG